MALAKALGATVNLAFAPHDPFDYCVANTVNSTKYLLARARGLPVVTIGWLRDSVASGDYLLSALAARDTRNVYRPPPLSGLSVCVTGYTQNERAEMETAVVSVGGSYSSDLVKGRCTHLVAINTTSSKYAHASKWEGVCVVDKGWLQACIEEGQRVDEAEFPVEGSAQFARRRDSTQKKENSSAEATQDFETIAGQLVPWDNPYMLNTRLYLHDFEDNSNEALRVQRIVRHAGAGTVLNPQKATHVVTREDPPVGSLRSLKEFREKVVHSSWLDACEAQEAVADEEPHIVAPNLFVAVAARGGAVSRAGDDKNTDAASRRAAAEQGDKARAREKTRESGRDGRVDRSRDAEPSRRKGGETPEKVNPLTRDALAKAARAEALAAAAVPADQNKPPNVGYHSQLLGELGTELPVTAFAVPETEIAGRYPREGGDEGGGSASAAVFLGMKVALSPLLSREEEDAGREFVAAGSGVCVSATQTSAYQSAQYVVCPAAPTAEERRGLCSARGAEREKQVTCHWLEMCVQQGYLVGLVHDPAGSLDSRGNPAYRPLPCDAPLPSMQNLRISTSAYDERVKAGVHMLCHLLGAKYTDRLGRNKNTHLIVPTTEGAKYTAAMGWGLHVVTVEWLDACVAAGRRVEEERFAPIAPPRASSSPPQAIEDDDETEAPGGSGQTTDFGNGKHGDYVPEAHEKDDDASPRPHSAQRQRGSQRPVGNATNRATLSAVLQVSQPVPTKSDVPRVAPPLPFAVTPAPKNAPIALGTTRPKPRPQTPVTQRPAVAAQTKETRTAPGARRDDGTKTRDPLVAGASVTPVRRGKYGTVPDGSQFAASMIDDLAANMLGGDPGGDPSMDAYGDGFRVPDAVFGKGKAVQSSPSFPSASQPDAFDTGGGVSSGKKRPRPRKVSQNDLETQQIVGLVGYADEPRRRGGGGGNGAKRRSGSKQFDVLDGGNAAGLVTSLIGGAGGHGGCAGAGLRAEDWE